MYAIADRFYPNRGFVIFICNHTLLLLCDYGFSENEDPRKQRTETRKQRPANEDHLMILIQELRVTLYSFTDEKQFKAWQLLCSQRDHLSVKKSEIADDYIKR